MIKEILHCIWTFSLQKGWNWIWSKTTIDEKAIAVTKEVKSKVKAAGVELKDVAVEAKDVISAVKGETKKRKKHGS